MLAPLASPFWPISRCPAERREPCVGCALPEAPHWQPCHCARSSLTGLTLTRDSPVSSQMACRALSEKPISGSPGARSAMLPSRPLSSPRWLASSRTASLMRWWTRNRFGSRARSPMGEQARLQAHQAHQAHWVSRWSLASRLVQQCRRYQLAPLAPSNRQGWRRRLNPSSPWLRRRWALPALARLPHRWWALTPFPQPPMPGVFPRPAAAGASAGSPANPAAPR